MDAQRSEEWFQQRAGRITASRMCDVLAFSKGEPGDVYKSGPRKGQPKGGKPLKARLDYIHDLAAERLTGCARPSIDARSLEWGREWEPVARQEYEIRTGSIVLEVGFALHPQYPFIGASPDWEMPPRGGGEIKCPFDASVHLATIENGLPPEHVAQIQGGMFVKGYSWWEFVSFHPAFPPHLRLYVQRIERDDLYIDRLEEACLSLEEEVRAIVDRHQRQEVA